MNKHSNDSSKKRWIFFFLCGCFFSTDLSGQHVEGLNQMKSVLSKENGHGLPICYPAYFVYAGNTYSLKAKDADFELLSTDKQLFEKENTFVIKKLKTVRSDQQIKLKLFRNKEIIKLRCLRRDSGGIKFYSVREKGKILPKDFYWES